MTDAEVDKLIADYEKIAIPDEEIDLSELPAFTDEELAQFKPAHPENFKPERKQITISVYSVLADHLQSIGDEWQDKVNGFLMNAYAMGQI